MLRDLFGEFVDRRTAQTRHFAHRHGFVFGHFGHRRHSAGFRTAPTAKEPTKQTRAARLFNLKRGCFNLFDRFGDRRCVFNDFGNLGLGCRDRVFLQARAIGIPAKDRAEQCAFLRGCGFGFGDISLNAQCGDLNRLHTFKRLIRAFSNLCCLWRFGFFNRG